MMAVFLLPASATGVRGRSGRPEFVCLVAVGDRDHSPERLRQPHLQHQQQLQHAELAGAAGEARGFVQPRRKHFFFIAAHVRMPAQGSHKVLLLPPHRPLSPPAAPPSYNDLAISEAERRDCLQGCDRSDVDGGDQGSLLPYITEFRYLPPPLYSEVHTHTHAHAQPLIIGVTETLNITSQQPKKTNDERLKISTYNPQMEIVAL